MNKEQAVVEMKELLTLIAKSLVDQPEEVSVESIVRRDNVTLELSVADEDMGRVIGKSGRRAAAIRTLIKAKAARVQMRAMVDIIDKNADSDDFIEDDDVE